MEKFSKKIMLPSDVVTRVLELHSERVAAYRALESAHRQLLLDEQETIFSLHTQAVTAEFQRISSELIALQKIAADPVKTLIGRLQAEERKKLAQTVKLQQLQVEHFIHDVRKAREAADVAEAERQGTNIVGHSHSHSHDGEIHSLADKPQPPASELYDRDAGAAARGIAEAIEEILEIVAELRETLSTF